ncbi:hypothetical protein VTH06DRAFT_7054 [Thermothelomyces fergusii]
MLKIL